MSDAVAHALARCNNAASLREQELKDRIDRLASELREARKETLEQRAKARDLRNELGDCELALTMSEERVKEAQEGLEIMTEEFKKVTAACAILREERDQALEKAKNCGKSRSRRLLEFLKGES